MDLRFLLLEDVRSDMELVRAVLEDEGIPCAVDWARDRREFEAAVRRTRYDLILSDYSLPDFRGYEALRLAKDECPDVPFVFVSGSIGEEHAVECLRQGATDYVLKDRLRRLAPVVRRALAEAEIRRARQRAVRELEEAARVQRALLEAASVARVVPWSGDPAAQHMELGDSALLVLGHPPHHFRDDPTAFSRLLVEEDRPLLQAALRQAAQGGPASFDARIRCGPGRGGEVVWTRWTLGLEQERLHGAIQDVSEAHRLQEQLLQSQKMESLGTFAGTIAHDFNNILQAVLGHAEMMALDPGLTDRGRGHLDTILSASEQGQLLVTQLLSFGRQTPSRQMPYDLNALVHEIQDLVRTLLGKEVDLQVYPEPGLPEARLDRGQMHQVLMNLVVNARDALPGGRGAIRVRTGRDADGAAQVVFVEVEDTGSGIPAEHLAHIFEPFYTTKEPGRGTGLGLSVVHGIVKSHQGQLRCESEVGKGTRFRVVLPVAV